ncbi:MAG TPA: hypothetical protein VGQ02_10295 [Candidatus Limnocylindrales bacterium]|jgi:hypothetical protein|nr:hypothetical protein [Candidatus Limnocylindrales bacterium]
MPVQAYLFSEQDGQGDHLGLRVTPPERYAPAGADVLGPLRGQLSSVRVPLAAGIKSELYLFEQEDFEGPFLRVSAGDEAFEGNLESWNWENRAQSAVLISTQHGGRTERAVSFRDLFLSAWQRTVVAQISAALEQMQWWSVRIDGDTSMTWDLAVKPRPAPDEAYVRITQGLIFQTPRGDTHVMVRYLVRITTPAGGGTPTGSAVLPWDASIQSGSNAEVIDVLNRAEASVRHAVEQELDVSFREIFGSHSDSTLHFRAFGIYALPGVPPVEGEKTAVGDTSTDVTIVLALQPIASPAAPQPDYGSAEIDAEPTPRSKGLASSHVRLPRARS